MLTPCHSVDVEDRSVVQKELQREVAKGHELFGHTRNARLFARGHDQDDFAYLLADGRVAVVHLTFASRDKENPPWPGTALYASTEERTSECMVPEHEDWTQPDSSEA